jgi:hypothetical protein
VIHGIQVEYDDEMVAGFRFPVDSAIEAASPSSSVTAPLVGRHDRDAVKAAIDQGRQLPVRGVVAAVG